MQRRTLLAAAIVGAALAASGCAGLNTVTVQVSTQTQWPAGRQPGSYFIERLPSQQAHAQEQERIEAAAMPAIEGAGFTHAASMQEADFLIQVGARTFEVPSRDVYASPFYWRNDWWFYGGWRPFFYGPGFYGPGYYGAYDVQLESAILIRDRRSQQIVYETRASVTTRAAYEGLLPLLFEASMQDFPTPALSPRSVTMRLPGR